MPQRRARVLKRVSAAVALGLAGCLAGCAYHGENTTSIQNPVVQKFSWFSFLDGNDIREACAALGPKAPDRYRLVYNAQYTQQVRAYEIFATPSGGATVLARAKGKSNLSDWWIQDSADLLAPWRWKQSNTALNPAEFGQFRAALAQAGYGSGAPQGLKLPSQDFYWVAAGCRQGQFHYYAWVERNGAFDNVPFQDFLLRHDGTGLPFRPPHRLSIDERQQLGTANGRDFRGDFSLQVHGEGLGGLINAF